MNQNGVTVNSVPQLQFLLVFIHSAQALIFDCGYPKLVAGMLVIHSVIFLVLFFDFYQRTYLKDRRAQKKLQ
jgi:elongation of very long chain fatty acids protein 7